MVQRVGMQYVLFTLNMERNRNLTQFESICLHLQRTSTVIQFFFISIVEMLEMVASLITTHL
jgi:archaellum biogenesis protein FlaJ (TadC family)